MLARLGDCSSKIPHMSPKPERAVLVFANEETRREEDLLYLSSNSHDMNAPKTVMTSKRGKMICDRISQVFPFLPLRGTVNYRDALKGGPVLLSNSQARPGKISRNLVKFWGSIQLT